MFFRIILLSTVLCGAVTTCLADSYFSGQTPAMAQQTSITPEFRFRARTFAREQDAIVNPIAWAPFKEMTPEGTRVKKGDVIFHLDLGRSIEDAQNLENQLEETQNQVAQKLASMEKTVSTLEDKLAEKQDARKVQVAKLNYLKSLPVAADIKIAEGRLSVSQAELVAKKADVAKSKERLEKGLISPAMLTADEEIYAEQKARTAFAETQLRLAKLPAHPLEIELVDYQIRNLDLEIEKVAAEIPIQQRILHIESQTQLRRIEDLTSRIDEKHEELNHEFLYAPADGVLIYAPQFKRDLVSGVKASKGTELAVIPRRESMALEGEIPEQYRHLFQLGDPALIQLNLDPLTEYRGKIASISPFSRDAVEGENPSGVKVVDLIIEFEDLPENLPLGIYSWVTIETAKPVTGWAIPAAWIKFRGGKAYASVKGKMETVNGFISGDAFVLTSPHPPTKHLQAEGEWVNAEDTDTSLVTDQFMVTGELAPYESEVIKSPRVRAWDIQIAWLAPENLYAEKGTTLIRLDSEQLINDLEKRELELDRHQSEMESAEKALAIRISEQAFQLASAQNRIEIKQRERDLVLHSGSTTAVAQANLNLTSAEIQKQKAETQLQRALKNEEWSSATERDKLQRELKRRTLELERSQINLQIAQEGATALQKSNAEIGLLREIASAAALKAQHNQAVTRAQSHLRWRKSRAEKSSERLERQRKDVKALEIKAPVSGLVKYLKVWDGVRDSKIKTGHKVYRGMQLMTLSAAEKLFVEVSIPERYIHYLEMDMPVSVRIPSEGGAQWEGALIHMEEILEPAAPSSTSQSLYSNQETAQEQILKVKILLDVEGRSVLKPGAIAQVIFPFEK